MEKDFSPLEWDGSFRPLPRSSCLRFIYIYIYTFEDLLEEAFVIKNECKKKKKRKNQVCEYSEYSEVVGYGCRKKKFCLLST